MGVLTVNQSVLLLINKLFDYAGLFPPAKYSLHLALQKFSEYQSHPQHEALGKFVFPINQAQNLIDFLSKQKDYFSFFPNGVLPLSVILSRCLQADEPSDVLLRDISDLKHICSDFAHTINFASFEFVPATQLREMGSYMRDAYFQALLSALNEISPCCEVFCEVPCEGEASTFWINTIAQARKLAPEGVTLGVKLRTGGVTPPQVPSAKHLAQTILQCTAHLLPIKLTAGLHVPTPNFNTDVGAVMHGFLNVLSAILLGANRSVWGRNVTAHDLETILTQYGYEDFRFQEDGLHIGSQFIVSQKLLKQGKQKYIRGIGSCEFIEPIEHLNQNYK